MKIFTFFYFYSFTSYYDDIMNQVKIFVILKAKPSIKILLEFIKSEIDFIYEIVKRCRSPGF